MPRMPIRLRSRLLCPERDVPIGAHAVLVRISPGYPTEPGRLHTRYSPVRRSPAKADCSASPLPLDLHVLSLSLAFILSQDQTLRCLYFVLFLFLRLFATVSSVRPVYRLLPVHKVLTGDFFRRPKPASVLSYYFVYCNCFNVLFCPPVNRSFPKASAKL